MYPFIILGAVALVTFIILQTANRNDMMNAIISLVVGVIVTYLIVYLRMSDTQRNYHDSHRGDRRHGHKHHDDRRHGHKHHDDRRHDENDNFLFWFNPKY